WVHGTLHGNVGLCGYILENYCV
ncbi:uncharacterized protein METZ01_LOCUS324718, partial [marine metagenome]